MVTAHQTTSNAPPEPTSNAVGGASSFHGYSGQQTNNGSNSFQLPVDGQDSASLLENLLNFNPSRDSREIQDQSDDQFQSLLNAVVRANARGQARFDFQDQLGANSAEHEIAEHEDQQTITTAPESSVEPQNHLRSDTRVQEIIEHQDQPAILPCAGADSFLVGTFQVEPQDQPASSPQVSADSFFVRTFRVEVPSSKRKRDDDQQESGQQSAKRKESEHVLAKQREVWGPEDTAAGEKDARVLSAAALFRKPTKDSNSYTRPPMSSVFFDLELGIDEFVQIQAAAKQYMLDPNHPDRDQCVNPNRDEFSNTKLKMWETCKAFLEDEGWGERLWGADAPYIDEPERTLKWPNDKNKIIKKLIHLLRRQITNERQRKYSLENRKNKKKTPKKGPQNLTDGVSTGSPQSLPELESGQAASPPLFDPFVDGHAVESNLDQYPFSVERSVQPDIQPENGEGNSAVYSQRSFMADVRRLVPDPNLKYYVNVLQGGRRVLPRLDLAPHNCLGFADLVQHIRNYIATVGSLKTIHIKALLPDVMFAVFDEDSWRHAIRVVMESDWMDGEARFVAMLLD